MKVKGLSTWEINICPNLNVGKAQSVGDLRRFDFLAVKRRIWERTDFENTTEYKWLYDNAYKFGFIISFQLKYYSNSINDKVNLSYVILSLH